MNKYFNRPPFCYLACVFSLNNNNSFFFFKCVNYDLIGSCHFKLKLHFSINKNAAHWHYYCPSLPGPVGPSSIRQPSFPFSFTSWPSNSNGPHFLSVPLQVDDQDAMIAYSQWGGARVKAFTLSQILTLFLFSIILLFKKILS